MILQRHAKAEKASDDDISRSLTPGGLIDAANQGEAVRQLEIFPELILHSPAMRARQTAEIMAAKLELSQGYTIEDNELYNCDSSELVTMIRHLPDESDIILIVGHNPAIEIVADTLSNAGVDHFRPSEALIMHFDIEEWSTISQRSCRSSQFMTKPE